MSAPSSTAQLLKVFMAQAPDSDGVEEFQLRKQTPSDRVWQWLTRRSTLPPAGTWQRALLQLLDTAWFSVVVVLMTVLALFLVDISILASRTPDADMAVGGVILACFIFFLLEITASILVQDEYFLSFFFLCDAVGTISLIFDIPWIDNPLGVNATSSGAAVLRASRVARTATRATRVLRLLRTIRMPALARCCKRGGDDDEDFAAANASFEASKNGAGSTPMDGTTSAGSLPGGTGGDAVARHVANTTQVGSKLQLVVSKRVIFLVTIMIFVIPLLSDSELDHARPVALDMLEATTALAPPLFNQTAAAMVDAVGTTLFVHVRMPGIGGIGDDSGGTYPWGASEPDLSHLREAARTNVSSSSGRSYALFDDSDRVYHATVLSLCMSIFTIVLFGGGSILFTQDAERLFFKPIERMIKTIKRLAHILFEMDDADSALGGGSGGADGGGGGGQVAVDETILIEAVVARVADIFAVRLERDGVKRKTTLMKTASSRWRIHVEEEECAFEGPLLSAADLARPVRSKDLLLVHEIEELASVARCLESPLCTQYFSSFLRDEYSGESVLFLLEARGFRLAAERLQHQARQLYSLFLSDEAVNQVAVDWTLRRATHRRMHGQMGGLAELFAPVENELMAALSRDAFPRFLRSLHCLRLLKHLTLQRQQRARRRNNALTQGQQQSQQRGTAGHADADGDSDPQLRLLGRGSARLQQVELDEIRAELDHQA